AAGGAHVNEAERWVEFGIYLRQQRDNVGLSRREAARRSKVPESTWKDLETGHKTSYGGVRVLPNPGADVLDKIAKVLELSPQGPFSTPMPLHLAPPKGWWGASARWVFTQAVPHSRRSATSAARSASPLQTDPLRPKWVALARSTASSTSR